MIWVFGDSLNCSITQMSIMSNKFKWQTYDVPQRWIEGEDEPPDASDASITIRHLKQGATGAVKTWPAASVLLEYLVQRGGLR